MRIATWNINGIKARQGLLLNQAAEFYSASVYESSSANNVGSGAVNVSYREGMATQVRVHGQLYLIAGVLLLMPLLGALAVEFSREWLGVQVSFAAIMAVVMVGGWVLLKLVRRNY